MQYYGTRNPRAKLNPLRMIPLLRPAAHVLRPTETDAMVGDLRRALWAVSGWAKLYRDACAALGKANRIDARYRRANQSAAMSALNKVRAAMRANLRTIATLEAKLLKLAVPADMWAQAKVGGAA